MTFWELVENKTFYWQAFTLSRGKQILADGRTKRRPMLMPDGTVHTRRLSVPADLCFYKVSSNDINTHIPDTWVAHFAGTTLTIRMLEEVESGSEPALVTEETAALLERLSWLANNYAAEDDSDAAYILAAQIRRTLEADNEM